MTLRQGKDIDGELWSAAQSNSEVTNPGQLNNCHNCEAENGDDNRYREDVDGHHYRGTSVTIMVMTIAIIMGAIMMIIVTRKVTKG